MHLMLGSALTLSQPYEYRNIIDNLVVTEEMAKNVWAHFYQTSSVIPDTVMPRHLVQAVLPAERLVDLSLVEASQEIGVIVEARTCLIDIKDTEIWIRTSKSYGCDHTYFCLCIHRIKLPFFHQFTVECTAEDIFGDEFVAQVRDNRNEKEVRDMQIMVPQAVRTYHSIEITNLENAHISLDKPGFTPAWLVQDLEVVWAVFKHEFANVHLYTIRASI